MSELSSVLLFWRWGRHHGDSAEIACYPSTYATPVAVGGKTACNRWTDPTATPTVRVAQVALDECTTFRHPRGGWRMAEQWVCVFDGRAGGHARAVFVSREQARQFAERHAQAVTPSGMSLKWEDAYGHPKPSRMARYDPRELRWSSSTSS
jgi:hypothetical protein